MTIASAVAKRLAIKKETTWNVLAGPTAAQVLRHVDSNINLVKDAYQSNEMRQDYQIADFRHGSRRVEGSIGGELSAGSYQMLLAAALRASQTWTTAPTTGALATVTAAVTVSPAGTFTRSTGSYLTDGFRIGHVLRWTGWTTTAVNNNARNFLITDLSATVMTGIFLDGTPVVAKAAGDSVTGLGFKSAFTPLTAHANDSFTIEHWHADVAQSEQFTGCKVNTVGLSLPASGLATVNFGMLGGGMTTGTAQYFTTPTAAGTTGILAAANGAIYVGGVRVGTITAMNANIAGGMSTGAVVGSNNSPDVFVGRVTVTGDVSAYFEDAVMRDLFINETAGTIILALTAGNGATDDVFSLVLPNVKFGSASKSGNEVIQQMSFQALIASASATGHHQTTMMICDTAAA